MSEQELLTAIEVANSRPRLKTVKGWIRQGWIAGLILYFLTLLPPVVDSVFYSFTILDIFYLIVAFPILVMTFGIYKKSRVSSTFMFICFVGINMQLFIKYGIERYGMIYLVFSLIFAYLYFQAMMGTFIYHRTVEDLKTQALLDKEYRSELVNY